MEIDATPGLADEIAAAFDWWREAGVEYGFLDEAKSWLAGPEPVEAAPPGAATQELLSPAARAAVDRPAVDRGAWPRDLPAFIPWWLGEPSLDGGDVAGRVPPRGAQGAPVMVVVAQPEHEDRGKLLSGPQGRLLDAMLAAMGIESDLAYVASVLPRHTPHADWAAVRAAGLGEVLCHHLTLAAPQRLIVFGDSILPLLGNDPAHNADASREFNHEGGKLPLLAARDLAALLGRPQWKPGFWQSWLDWTAGVANPPGSDGE